MRKKYNTHDCGLPLSLETSAKYTCELNSKQCSGRRRWKSVEEVGRMETRFLLVSWQTVPAQSRVRCGGVEREGWPGKSRGLLVSDSPYHSAGVTGKRCCCPAFGHMHAGNPNSDSPAPVASGSPTPSISTRLLIVSSGSPLVFHRTCTSLL